MAPPIDCTPRAKISTPTLFDAAAMTEPSANSASPMRKTFLRPDLSAHQPLSSSSDATPMLYVVRIHDSVDSAASGNASRISGSASAMIVISRLTMNTTAEVMPSVRQADCGIGTGAPVAAGLFMLL